jgi:hypothetical protein
MSFGESVFYVGFIQKTVKVDLHVRINCAYPQQNGHQKVPEDSRGLHTDATCRPAGPWGPRVSPRRYIGSPPPPRMHLRRSLSRFDPRAHD